MLNITRRVTHRYAVLDVTCLVEDEAGRTQIYKQQNNAEVVRDAFRNSEPNPKTKQHIRIIKINT